jgi:hypothetical protein
MPPTDRTQQLLQISLHYLVTDLLRQFNKPSLLGKYGVILNKAQMDIIAEAVSNQAMLPALVQEINSALAQLVQASVAELQSRFGLTFAEALAKTDLSEVGDWQTTAEFLEIANHKSNAELRISAGTSLMVFLGDVRYADYLFTVIQVDAGLDDVDAMIAKRALAHYSQIELGTENWEIHVKRMLRTGDRL